MKICICQYDIEWEDKQKNKEKILSLVSDISGVDLIIFPETCLTGFSFNKAITSLTQYDIDFFRSIAENKKSFICFGGVIDEKNACIIINPAGQIILKTSKIHLFSLAGEDIHYKPGAHINSVRINSAGITPFICYDLRFAPLFWVSAEKTDIFIVIANWPETRKHHWKSLLVARAIENQAFVVGVNRIGISPKEKYNGDSCVLDPWGMMVFDCGSGEGAFIVEINIEKVKDIRENFPFLRDRKKIY
ncbi:MAG: carbon-nitrogen family hydrolase [bacterium]|nr:carbon-nitrogen family hydrolase [bacterium]